jgi:hypothetical protein
MLIPKKSSGQILGFKIQNKIKYKIVLESIHWTTHTNYEEIV